MRLRGGARARRIWWNVRIGVRRARRLCRRQRRCEPVSRLFGLDRGRPIDRYYIEAFLAKHAGDVRGHVLEVGDDQYTRMFGSRNVECSDVLHAVPGNPAATVVGDLASGTGVPESRYDCMIVTQTLQFIPDAGEAVKTLFRALRPGGVVLATVPGISQVSRYDMDRWGDYWRFTNLGISLLFERVFGKDAVSVCTYGNALVACGFLQGLAAEEFQDGELDYADEDYPVTIAVRATRSAHPD